MNSKQKGNARDCGMKHEIDKDKVFIKWQQENGGCRKCRQKWGAVIQTCEIEGFCRHDKQANKEWRETMEKL